MQDNGAHDEIIANFLIITGCKNDEKALQYLSMSNYQLETAISLYMELENQPSVPLESPLQQSQQQQKQPEQFSNINQQGRSQISDLTPEITASNQQLIEQYKRYKEQKEEVGVFKKIWTNTLGTVSSIFSKQTNYGEEFQKYLQQKKIKIDIRFQMGSFQENIERAQNEVRPLIVYIHEMQQNNIILAMFQCKNFVQIVNKNYTNYGFLANAETMSQLPQQVEHPCIVIYRTNFIEQICQMSHFPLNENTNFEQLGEQIKRIKGQFNKIFMQEELIKKQINEPQPINPHSVNQYRQYQQQQEQIQRQQQQQKERDFLRQEQEFAYKQAEQQAKEKQQQLEEKKKKEQERILEEQLKEEQRQLMKATLLSNLPEVPEGEGIDIQFRFLEEVKTRKFRLTDKIQTLFDFVQCQDDACFNNYRADLDLIQNFPRLSLKDKKDQKIEDVFIDSTGEQLIVEELE